jgi:hypothetical protein
MAAVTLPTIGPPCLTEGGLRLRYNPYAPSAKQAAFLALTCDEALYGGAAYGGKLLSVDTLVPTPTGFRKLGEIHPGDLVYGANGRPRLVEAEWEQSAPGYLLTFDDGSTVVANDEHLWITHTNAELQSAKRRTPEYRERRRAERPRRGTGKRPDLATRNAERPEPEATSTGTTRTTAEIVATLRDGRGRANHQIPVCAPLYRHDQQLPLDPYLLGVWLGDGTTLAGAITTMDLEIYDAFPRAGMQVSGLRGKEGTQASCFTAYGLVTILRYLGVLGDKHVPERYLWASEEQRVALLAGLIDTDGHVTADTGQVEFCNTNRQLADSVAHLARSLGMKAVVTVGRATLRGVDCGPKYRVKFTPNRSDISRLPRKRDHLKVGSTTRSSWRRIVSAERVDPQPMKCLRVSSPDHQFLVTEHLIPTHNSIALLMAALQFADVPGYNALIVRRSLADLELPDGLIDISKDWLSGTGATYNGNKHQWTFPSGATLTFGYLAHYGSETRYKSSQLQFIGFDELTEFPWEEQYEYLFSRLRRNTQAVGAAPDGTAMADVPLRVRGATNPGGVGMTWVKRRFVDPATAIAPFLPSKMTDNPGADEDYANSLAKLSEVERKRLQDGDWDVVEMPGALWKFKDFEWTDRLEPRPVSEVDVRVMSVDPAVTDETGKGDETGILMGSVTNGTLTVELDLSGKMHPDDWARLIVTAYNTWGCSSIIVEDNQGKALLNIALGNAADQLGLPRPTIYTITAKDSKEARAIPVVQAYRSTPRRVYHDLALKGGALEAQLTSWVPRRNTATIQSPDRLDALVWLVRHGLWNEGKSSGYRRARTAMAQMSGKMPGA